MSTKALAAEQINEAEEQTHLTEEQLDAVSGGVAGGFLTVLHQVLDAAKYPITTYAPGHCPGQNQ
jgi:hypothetical protein